MIHISSVPVHHRRKGKEFKVAGSKVIRLATWFVICWVQKEKENRYLEPKLELHCNSKQNENMNDI